MPHHVSVRVPDGRDACADWRDPIVKAMRRINKALSEFREPPADALAEVTRWLDANSERSAACIAAGYSCTHDDEPPPGCLF